jgi:hypothetical protein
VTYSVHNGHIELTSPVHHIYIHEYAFRSPFKSELHDVLSVGHILINCLLQFILLTFWALPWQYIIRCTNLLQVTLQIKINEGIQVICSHASKHWNSTQPKFGSLCFVTGVQSKPSQVINLRPILTFILTFHTHLGLLNGLCLWGCLIKFSLHISLPPHVLHVPPISFSLTWSP